MFAIDPPPAGIEALHEDRFGTLWIGADNGLYRRWPDGRVIRYTKRDGFPDDYIHDLHEDRDGRLWVATRLGGFFALAIDARPAAACGAAPAQQRERLRRLDLRSQRNKRRPFLRRH